jgi:hypothetical protein
MDALPPKTPAVPAEVDHKLVALGEFYSHLQNTHELTKAFNETSALALSYENHLRQVKILQYVHIPLTLTILVLAACGGHVHAVHISLVYLVLIGAFVLSVAVFGVRIRYAWMPRTFALSLIGVAVWSTTSVLYAIYTQFQMRLWYDILLLVLQAGDLALCLGHFYTIEMLTHIGGEASAAVAELHDNQLMLAPHAHELGTAASANYALTRPAWYTRFIRGLSTAMAPVPRSKRA